MTAIAAPELHVSDRTVGYRRVIALQGCLQRGTAATLQRAFWDAVECGAQQIWLDLSRLAAIDRSSRRSVPRTTRAPAEAQTPL